MGGTPRPICVSLSRPRSLTFSLTRSLTHFTSVTKEQDLRERGRGSHRLRAHLSLRILGRGTSRRASRKSDPLTHSLAHPLPPTLRRIKRPYRYPRRPPERLDDGLVRGPPSAGQGSRGIIIQRFRGQNDHIDILDVLLPSASIMAWFAGLRSSAVSYNNASEDRTTISISSTDSMVRGPQVRERAVSSYNNA